MFARWIVLIRGLVGSQQVPFGPVEETAVGEALRILTGYRTAATRLVEVTIPQLWRSLDEPTAELVTACPRGSTRSRSGRSGTTGTAWPPRSASAARRSCSAAGSC